MAPVTGYERAVGSEVGAHVLVLGETGRGRLAEALGAVLRYQAAHTRLAPVGDRQGKREVRVDAVIVANSNGRLRWGQRVVLAVEASLRDRVPDVNAGIDTAGIVIAGIVIVGIVGATQPGIAGIVICRAGISRAGIVIAGISTGAP